MDPFSSPFVRLYCSGCTQSMITYTRFDYESFSSLLLIGLPYLKITPIIVVAVLLQGLEVGMGTIGRFLHYVPWGFVSSVPCKRKRFPVAVGL